MSQRDETTPSPVSKEDGSNKRIIVNQGTNSNKPKQPPALMEPAASVPNVHVAMEITLTSSGPDGKELPNSNPNHNPNPNPKNKGEKVTGVLGELCKRLT